MNGARSETGAACRVLEPEQWGSDPRTVQQGRDLQEYGSLLGIPLYLVGLSDGTRIVIVSVHPPGSAAWNRGVAKAHAAVKRGVRGIHGSSTP